MGRGVLAVIVVVVLALVPAATASAWAPAGQATVTPGVQTFTGGGQCTANFIFSDGTSTYIGQSAHCASTGAATDTNGCEAGTLPLGTPVEISGASRPGTLVYSSWVAMQERGETNADACEFNDFALVRIDPADVARVNPSVPRFGGPTGLAGTTVGETVYSYGNSSLRLGVRQLSPKQGTVLAHDGSGWSHTVLTVTPGIPGDSGSGFMNAAGRAFGTLSTLAILPIPASNGVGDLAKELAYARANGFPGVGLVNGTEPFRPNLINAILGS